MQNNVVTLRPDHAAEAKARRERLWNPPNARASTELDVVTGLEWRKRQQSIADQQAEIRKAEADFRRELAVDNLLREALAEHTLVRRTARQIILNECYAPPPKIAQIINYVRTKTGITRVDILSARRTARVSSARQIIMYLARRLTFRSMPEIGRMLGGRDHTTVLHGVRKIESRMVIDPEFKVLMDEYACELAGAGV